MKFTWTLVFLAVSCGAMQTDDELVPPIDDPTPTTTPDERLVYCSEDKRNRCAAKITAICIQIEVKNPGPCNFDANMDAYQHCVYEQDKRQEDCNGRGTRRCNYLCQSGWVNHNIDGNEYDYVVEYLFDDQAEETPTTVFSTVAQAS